MRVEQRLQSQDRAVVSPVSSQLGGFLLSLCIILIGIILFENTIAEWVNVTWAWILRVPTYIFLAVVSIRFFKAGLMKEPMPIGSAAIPRIFGAPVEKAVLKTGRHWEIPGKGNKSVTIDMRSEEEKLELFVTTEDNVKMVCKLNLNYYVYDQHIFAETKNFKNTFSSMLSQAFLGFASKNTANAMLKMNKTRIIQAIVKHIKAMPGTDFKLQDFGIEVQKSTISVSDGFDFADQRTRDAYELETREKMEREGQIIETEHFINLANQLVEGSGNTLSFEEAYLRILQRYGEGKNLPEEKILRLAGLPEEVIQFLKQIFNRKP